MAKPKEPTEKELDQAIDACAKILKITRAQFVRLARVMLDTPGCVPKKS